MGFSSVGFVCSQSYVYLPNFIHHFEVRFKSETSETNEAQNAFAFIQGSSNPDKGGAEVAEQVLLIRQRRFLGKTTPSA